MVAILPAETAVPFAQELLAHLERSADGSLALGEHSLGACAGVALAGSGYPMRQLLFEAEALLKMAKRRVYRGDGARSALAYKLVHDGSPRAESIEPERFCSPSEKLLHSGIPYSLPELEQVSARLRVFRGYQGELGLSQLHAMVRFGLSGPNQLRSHALYQVARHEAWHALIRELVSLRPDERLDAECVFTAIAPRYGDVRVFDLPDLLPLLDHWREPGEREVVQ